MKRFKSGSGFTLIEILVVIAIVAIAGTILVAIFTNTLRGSNKSQILSAIKQNGQAALDTISIAIRSSDTIICPPLPAPSPPASPTTSVTSQNLVVAKEGSYTRFRFVEPSPSPAATVNGYIEKDTPKKEIVQATGLLETDAAFVNRVCNINDPMSSYTNAVVLTDTNTQSGVSVSSGVFTRSKPSGFKDNVAISFIIGAGVAALDSQIDSITFQTTIDLR